MKYNFCTGNKPLPLFFLVVMNRAGEICEGHLVFISDDLQHECNSVEL